MGKWFLFDLDGTLFNDEYKVPQGTHEFLKDITKKGYKTGIVTGRPYESVMELVPQDLLDDMEFFATYNGARIDYKGKEEHYPVPKSYLETFKDNICSVSVSIGPDLYVDKQEQARDIINKLKPRKIIDLSELKNDPYMIRLEHASAEECQKHYNELVSQGYDKKFSMVMSSGLFILIGDKCSSKNQAIKILEDEDVTFFGDSHNDLGVFQNSKIRCVAPSNAFDIIKKNADIVLETSNNETLRIDL